MDRAHGAQARVLRQLLSNHLNRYGHVYVYIRASEGDVAETSMEALKEAAGEKMPKKSDDTGQESCGTWFEQACELAKERVESPM